MATTVGVTDVSSSIAARRQAAPASQSPRQKTASGSRPVYMFIHTIRFWCMLAIVVMHCAIKFIKYEAVPLPCMTLMVQPFKFGTIGFFLISGFLLGDRLPASEPLGYLKRRASRLLPAWLFWYGLQVAFVLCRDMRHVPVASLSASLLLFNLYTVGQRCLTETALWFVPNFMVALTCVVLLRRWLNDLRLGAALLAVNLFYVVNVYMRWLPSRHTEAVFGFVFYLWLGAWCALRKEALQEWASAIPASRLAVCALLATGGALIEARLLSLHGSPDALNSLRLSNQVYSVLMVLILLRIRRVTWPGFVDVAETTYGIYLTHSMVVSLVFSAAALVVFRPGHFLTPLGIVLMWLVMAPITYMAALGLTKCFAATPWPWLIGATKRTQTGARLVASAEPDTAVAALCGVTLSP